MTSDGRPAVGGALNQSIVKEQEKKQVVHSRGLERSVHERTNYLCVIDYAWNEATRTSVDEQGVQPS